VIKIVSWMAGLGMGGAVGTLLVMVLVPTSREEIVRRLKTGLNETMAEARRASADRRAQLEAELAWMQGRPILPPEKQLPEPKKKR
jgi:hypothetical protein